jgi:hypothetical protein
MSEQDALIVGAEAIAKVVYGDEGKTRQVYHLAERGYLPIFRLGGQLAARQSTISAYLAEQERKALTKRRVA